MARSMDIFVKSDMPIELFVKEIEVLLTIELQRISDVDGIYYEHLSPHLIFTVTTHDLVNDRDLNFEDYPYQLSIRALHAKTEAESKRWRDEFTDIVFQKLKKSQRYPLMLVEDVQVKLDAFRPGPETVHGLQTHSTIEGHPSSRTSD